MPELRRKQTARKTTGSHAAFNARMSAATTYNNPYSRSNRLRSSGVVQTLLPGCSTRSPVQIPNHARVTKPKPVLKRPLSSAADASPPAPSSAPSSRSTSSFDIPLSFAFTASSPLAGPGVSTSTALIRQRPAVGVLDKPISVCTQFATWLENQSCVRDDAVLCAIERDGHYFLRLAKATVMFDDALRGHVPPPTAVNDAGAPRPLSEHARTLRAFAELLQSKISQDSLNEELETAVLRDGEPLLRLALSCLDFDQVIRGSGGGVC